MILHSVLQLRGSPRPSLNQTDGVGWGEGLRRGGGAWLASCGCHATIQSRVPFILLFLHMDPLQQLYRSWAYLYPGAAFCGTVNA